MTFDDCEYEWDGNGWNKVGGGCVAGQCCPVPTQPGSYIGETVFVACIPC